MKTRLIILIISLILSTQLYSQEIVDSSKMWSIIEEHCQPWGSTYTTEFFKFDKDTIVENTTYKKVWVADDENHEQWNFYGAFIREIDGRVYYREMFGEEGLIYDFNLQLGDSAVINNPRAAGELTLVLEQIDTIQLVDGFAERWRLSNTDYPNYEYWIRGVGSGNGVINSSTGVYGGLCGLFTLLCEDENNIQNYQNPDYDVCYLYITGLNENKTNLGDAYTLTYNGFIKQINIKFTKAGSKTIGIVGVSGNINYGSNFNGKTFVHDMVGLPSGIYIITVIEDNRVSTNKIFVN